MQLMKRSLARVGAYRQKIRTYPLGVMALHMGGVLTEIYPGSTWIRKFTAAVAALMVSGIVRLAESMVTQAHGVGG